MTAENNFRMIDVGHKTVTHRVAVAEGEIHIGAECFALVKDRKLPKGDVLTLAEIAGINGAKCAFQQIPLCHPMLLDQVKIITELDEARHAVKVFCFASTHAKTGVEMEALAGVNAALLTIYDLCKMVEPALTISGIQLLVKTGGKKGVWQAPGGVPAWIVDAVLPKEEPTLSGLSACVLTISDRASKGDYDDVSGRLLKEMLANAGADILDERLVADEKADIQTAIRGLLAKKPNLILTTGGTGVAPRDITPEAVKEICERDVPGVGEFLRAAGAKHTPFAFGSRAYAGTIGQTLIITLPGSPKAVREGLDALIPELLPHLAHLISKGKHHDSVQQST